MQIFKKIFWTDLWPIFNTFFSQHELIARAFRMDRVTIFSNGQPEQSERITIFFFFLWTDSLSHSKDNMTFLFRTDSPSCSRDLCKQIVDNMFDSSFRRFFVSLRCFVPSSRRPGVVVSLFRFVTWQVVSSLRGFVSLFRFAYLTALAWERERV